MRMTFSAVIRSLTVLGALALPTFADVVPTMIIDAGGGHTATITSTTGVLNYAGDLGGSQFSISLTQGKTQPYLPNAGLQLTNFTIDAYGAGTLTISFGAVGFTGPSYLQGGVLSAKGSVLAFGTPASVSISGYEDNTNTLFGTGNAVGTLSASATNWNSSSLGGSAVVPFSVSQPFSLMEKAVISFGTGGGMVTFDSTLAPIPEPAAVVLFAAVAGGFCFMLRRRRPV